MVPDSSEERPSWLVEDDPAPAAPESIVLGGATEPSLSEARQTQSVGILEHLGPTGIIGGAIAFGTVIAFGIAAFTTLGQPDPPAPTVQAPAYDAGTVPVHKGIRKSNSGR